MVSIIQSRQRGFTLVELLIAFVLIGIILVLLFSGLRFGSRAWDGIDKVNERVTELRLVREFIARTLRSARAVSVQYDEQTIPVFAGDAQQLEWVAPLSVHVGTPGLYILRLTIEDAGQRQRLVLTRWLLHPEVIAGGNGDYPAWSPLLTTTAQPLANDDLDRDLAAGAYGRTVLLSAVGRFELAYFGVQNGDTEPSWAEEWNEQPQLPQAISVDLTTPTQTWPLALIPLPGATMVLTNDGVQK